MTPEGEERLPALRGYMVSAIAAMAIRLIQVTTH
jgi:hypothetical protein